MPPLARRLISIPGVFLGAAAALGTAPLWLPAAAGIDLLQRGRTAALRTGLVASWVLSCEAGGVLAAGALWAWHVGGARARGAYRDRNFTLQCRWAGALLRGAQAILGFELHLEPGGAPATGGPVLLLIRHVSIADALLPAWLLSIPHGIRLRYVLKRELLWEPCLDLVGHRLPNVFVDRDGLDGATAVAAVADLASDLGPFDGVLIYPEGTRFTPEKQRRARERLRCRGDPALVAQAESLRHLLPPRLGGTLALLERFAVVGAGHVIVCGHTGFEGSARLADLWRGGLVRRRVRVRCWSTPAAALPEDRRAWLFDAWHRVDDWLDGIAGQA